MRGALRAHELMEKSVDLLVLNDAEQLDEVGPLFMGMVEHHREVAGHEWPVRNAEDAWSRRRQQYESWLEAGRCWLLLAVRAETEGIQRTVGYAVVRISPSGPTWDLGDVAEVESLAVAEDARSAGIGGRLMEAARELVRAEGVTHWLVSVVESNDGAMRFYERHGFRRYYRNLLGEV